KRARQATHWPSSGSSTYSWSPTTKLTTTNLPARSGLSGAVGTDNAGVGSRSGGVPPSAHGRATSNTATTATATAAAAPNIPARARLLDPPTTATPPTLQRLFPRSEERRLGKD